jgi:uncharacterized secreted protein with C-terminal beta-propeller domain
MKIKFICEIDVKTVFINKLGFISNFLNVKMICQMKIPFFSNHFHFIQNAFLINLIDFHCHNGKVN